MSEKNRIGFEEWARSKSFRIDRLSDGSYWTTTDRAWIAWNQQQEIIDSLNSELAALKQSLAQPAQAAVLEWQPIETAPKEDRTILLGYFNRCGNWRTVRGQWMSQEYIDEYWEDPDCGAPGWHETAEEADPPNCWHINPTHWMPLPAAPEREVGV